MRNNQPLVPLRRRRAYIRKSIIYPPAKIVTGYERGEYAMPSYADALTDSQIEAIILLNQTLK